MARTPRIEVDLDKLSHNVQVALQMAQRSGVEVAGVTKGVGGDPVIARAMTGAGLKQLADSRVENLQRLQSAGVEAEYMLLRPPPSDLVEDAVFVADVSLQSEVELVRRIGIAAREQGKVHGVVLMVEMGDLREGVMPGDAVEIARLMEGSPGVELVGVGANLACFAGIVPNREVMERFACAAKGVEEALGRPLRLITGGNSANMIMLEAGSMPDGVNHLRLGEAILLGRETTGRLLIDGMHDDVFRVVGEVVELKKKPSVPWGELGQNAFGEKPEFSDRGEHNRAILALGKQDVLTEGLQPRMEGVEVLGASSDSMICHLDENSVLGLGDEIAFQPDYGALLQAMVSTYVAKVYFGEGLEGETNRRNDGKQQ